MTSAAGLATNTYFRMFFCPYPKKKKTYGCLLKKLKLMFRRKKLKVIEIALDIKGEKSIFLQQNLEIF